MINASYLYRIHGIYVSLVQKNPQKNQEKQKENRDT